MVEPQDISREVPPLADVLFGPRVDLARRYVELLADTGVSHGLIGPHEAPRLWTRHVLNCAVVASAVAPAGDVIDVGSGAGLPGIPLAIARPDLTVHLVEPLLRRSSWLTTTVSILDLRNVHVHRGRAQDVVGELHALTVTARAVARLALLAQWCLPLVDPGGSLLAFKGASAAAELEDDRDSLPALGAESANLEVYGLEVLDPPTQVVRVVKGRVGQQRSRPAGATRGRRPRRHDGPS